MKKLFLLLLLCSMTVICIPQESVVQNIQKTIVDTKKSIEVVEQDLQNTIVIVNQVGDSIKVEYYCLQQNAQNTKKNVLNIIQIIKSLIQ